MTVVFEILIVNDSDSIGRPLEFKLIIYILLTVYKFLWSDNHEQRNIVEKLAWTRRKSVPASSFIAKIVSLKFFVGGHPG